MTDTDPNEPTVTSGEVVSAPDVTGEWLTPPAAALRLGVSERTLWRDVKAGKYHRRIVDRKALILVPDSSATVTPSSETALTPSPDTGANLERVADLADRLTRQSMTVTRQAVQITRLTADRQQLRATLAAERQRADAAEDKLARLPRWLRAVLRLD